MSGQPAEVSPQSGDSARSRHEPGAMFVTRRKITVACEFCRKRKRRCDGLRPSCTNCAEHEATCVYPKLMTERYELPSSNAEMLEETLSTIQQQNQVISRNLMELKKAVYDHITPATSSTPGGFKGAVVYTPQAASPMPATATTPAAPPVAGQGAPADTTTKTEDEDVPLTIPHHHSTSASKVLQLPYVRRMVGNYEEDYFLGLESRNSMDLDEQKTPFATIPIATEENSARVNSFFQYVHPHYPILDESKFIMSFDKVASGIGTYKDVEYAIVLLVLALGAAIQNEQESTMLFKMGHATMRRGTQWMFKKSIEDIQAGLLCGIYFAYKVRPLESWQFIYESSVALQILLRSPCYDIEQEIRNRCFWCCFTIECDRVAELDLPRSGIDLLADQHVLPGTYGNNREEMVYFLAEISIRRLLNRIHHSFYSGTKLAPSVMLAVCFELRRQLENWLESIPSEARPDVTSNATGESQRKKILRIRYFAAKQIIYRPFVLAVLEDPNTAPSMEFLQNCQEFVECCHMYLGAITSVLEAPSPYTWTLSQSSLTFGLILLACMENEYLRKIVVSVRDILMRIIDNAARWAPVSPTIQQHMLILQATLRKAV